MQVQFSNKQPRLLGTCTGRKLKPGKNLFDMEESELQKILQDQQFKNWQKLGWVAFIQGKIEVEKKEENKKPSDDLLGALEELNAEQAKDKIADCDDCNLLKSWHELDKRKGVQGAIEERIAELEAGEDGP